MQSITCIHKTLHFYVLMRQFVTVVERVTAVMHRAPVLKKGLMTKNIIHNNIDGNKNIINPQ